MNTVEIRKISEFDINGDIQDRLQRLLCECFGGEYPVDRIYFKQKPHLRFLAYIEDRLIGHIACDYRVMNLNGERINVLSLIDVCVSSNMRSRGIGSQLLKKIDEFCHDRNIDYIVLFADDPDLYERNGFQRVQNRCKWLKIKDKDQTTYGIGHEFINELMVKAVGGKGWKEGELDLLGYLG
ncbi:GNAT family N-acetyltransferase [Rossellomorea sp. YZS02]|uniref:GNAT family N-acetyltransferase n=1 Tax=Rossellomorea sp. YZS02 TaxID=3097358 RepID=UPI002A0C16A0|nr:GNAT family N-acetyltransferase [Rossellomorea sp. YZS02]MDX8342263.1 GNAT family N-acetyltransferase [Rossellomorea sp. YZS02]